jgi:thiol:disulfide interchange protein/DsbC/DsbD-like thiol-disulfide interchange protein
MPTFLRVFAWFALFAPFAAGHVLAASVKTPHVEAELIARHKAIAPGQPIEAALRLKIIDHWHTYWQNPGDSGLPTKLKWTLPPGFTAEPIQWPHPKKLPLGPLMNFGYEGEVLHLVKIAAPANLKAGEPVTLKAKAEWLVCADVCIPEDAELALTLPSDPAKPSVDARWEQAFVSANAALPMAKFDAINTISAKIEGDKLVISGKTLAAAGGTLYPTEVMFYPYTPELIANAAAQVLAKSADGFTLTVPLAEPLLTDLTTLDGVLVATPGWSAPANGASANSKAMAINAPLVYAAGSTAAKSATGVVIQPKLPQTPPQSMSFIAALGFALLGGLILNLMPCVFPVLGIKVMGFVDAAHGQTSALRRQGLAFFIGVVVSFLALAGLMLALRVAGQSIGWGFQLQEPAFVAALAILFFLMALNLSGVFEMGMKLQSLAGTAEMNAQKNPLAGAFASGVLATVVATPCMAPGLGASVGYTLGQSAPIALAIFLAIGVGLALPVLLLSLFPAALKKLPKPGAWMETFKQFMAFPLYLTVVWLAWVLGSQTGNDGVAKLLVALTVFALAAWLYGRLQIRKPVLGAVFAMMLAGVGAAAAWSAARTELPAQSVAADSEWIPFTKEKIAALRAEGKGVFVDFTATWCITCQVNKRVALNDADLVKRFGELNIVRMKADWTRKDAAITAALAEFGRNGVPLYVFYPPKSGEPVILPEVLTTSIVLDHVKPAATTVTTTRTATN